MRRGRTRAARVAGVVCAVAVLLAACGGSGAGRDAAGLDTVSVGVVPIVDVAPLYLGMEQGFFAERGLQVEVESGQGGAALIPAVTSGQLDIGFTNNTSLLLARSRGLPLTVVAAGSYSTGVRNEDYMAIVAAPGSGVADAADLAGRTVAVNTLNNVGDTTVRQSVERAGGDPDGVAFVELAFPDMPAALAQGRVDAAWIVEPFLTIAVDQGAVPVASPLVDTADEFMIASYVTSEELARSDLVGRFTAAMNESLEFAAGNPQAAREAILGYTQIDPDVARRMTLPRWSSEVHGDTLRLLADLAEDDGLLQEPVDVEALLP